MRTTSTVALTFGDAFTLEAANANDTLEWVKSLDFFAIIDIYHSSAVDYADIVLPRAPNSSAKKTSSSCVRAMATSCWRTA